MTNQDSAGIPDLPDPPAPRRIAFCITDLDPGGAEKALLQLVTRLDRSTWDPTVFCLGPEAALTPRIRAHAIPVKCYGARGRWDLGVFFWLAKQLRDLQPQLLQCFLFHGNLVGRLAGRWAGVPVIVAGHRVAEREHRWHLWLERWTRHQVTHHVCVSQGVAAHVQDQLHVPAADITVIPNGVEAPAPPSDQLDIRCEFGFPPDAPIVLAVGRLHPQKGFMQLLEAFQIVSRLVPESRLLIVGEGAQRAELEKSIKQRGLRNLARLAGYRDDTLDLMRQSTLLVMSSLWEGMPNVVLEAMACGLPVVSMQVEGISELFESDRYGLVVSQGDIIGLAQSIERLLQSPELRLKLAIDAQQIVNKRFTWNQMAENYAVLYGRLID